MMNHSIKKILIVFGMVILASCKKSFLDVPPQGQPSPSLDPKVALDEVTAAYSALITPDPTGASAFGGYDIHGVFYIAVTNIISDDADKGSYDLDQPPAKDIDNFTLTSDNTYVAGLWRGHYAGISRTNNALNALASAALDSNLVKIRSAEMRFIRGYLYFNLVRMFGGVPLVLRVPSGPRETDSVFYYRASVADVYNKAIIPDLQYAINSLPLRSQTDLGRASKGAAETLLAKVYIYLKNWQKAYDLSQDVINSGQYILLPDYSQLWRQAGDNSAESIFEVETGIYGGADNGIPEYCEMQGPRQDNGMGIPTTPWYNAAAWNPTNDGGWGFDNPTPDLVNSYDSGDLRKAATIIDLPASGPPDTLYDGFVVPTMIGIHAYYNYKAWHSERRNNQIEVFYGDRSRKQKNLHILRYAETLLLNAEAANELGNSGTATLDITQVRVRANLGPSSASSQDDLRNAIWKERRMELAMEHDRFWDLVRQGRAAQVMQASGKTNFVAGKNELLPIPASEIALSGGKLTQNTGY
ncbi:MAG: RagB/SusD family nutrient uptake outer membrane protein [Chitinophagales bacterium]